MLAGHAVMINWSDVAPEHRPAYYEWHSREHMVGRISIPGFRRGRRYMAATARRDFLVLYEVADDRHLPAELRPEASGLRYVARPRHRQREPRGARPVAVRQDEVEELLRAARSWRDRFIVSLLWFCGLRIGETLGLRRSDLHLVASAVSCGSCRAAISTGTRSS